mgnify:CR=1 FL=1
MRSIYVDGRYEARNTDWHRADSGWKAGQIRRILDRNDVRPRSIVDVGCGAGAILRELVAGLGGVVTARGFDISPQAGASGVEFRTGDFFASEDRYDLLLLIDVFEHVPDCLGFLERVRPRAERFVFHIPLDLSASAVLRDRFVAIRREVGHLHHFTKGTALATLEDAGFEVVDWFFTRGALEVDSHHRGWKTALANALRRGLETVSEELAARLLGGYSLMVLARPSDRGSPAGASR